jgi:hypothetical protein
VCGDNDKNSFPSALTLICVNSISLKTREKDYSGSKLDALFSSRITLKMLYVGRSVNRIETYPVPHGAVRMEGINGIEAKRGLVLKFRVMEEKYLV